MKRCVTYAVLTREHQAALLLAKPIALTEAGCNALHDRIRFEERKLFVVAEAALDGVWLAAGAP